MGTKAESGEAEINGVVEGRLRLKPKGEKREFQVPARLGRRRGGWGAKMWESTGLRHANDPVCV